MKKTLLLLLIAGVWGSSQAQNSAQVRPRSASITTMQLANNGLKAKQAAEKAGISQSGKQNSNLKLKHPRLAGEPTLPPLGSSANVNGVRDATTTATTANQICDLIVMTHREDYSKEGNCGTGAYEAAYSTNNGALWDTSVIISCNQPSRYPNGALLNMPITNTNPLNVTDVMSGPWTNSATSGDSWVESVFASTTLEGTNQHESYWVNGTVGVYTENTGDLSFMSSSDDSTVHVIGQGYDVNSAGAYTRWLGAVLTTGKYSLTLDSVIWTQQLFQPPLVPGVMNWESMGLAKDSSASPLASPGTAWSQDGKTGYVVIFGNLDSSGFDYASDQPIVYKTVNSGKNWVMMPPYNFANLTSLTTYLYPGIDSTQIKNPLFYTFVVSLTGQSYAQGAENDYDMTVDENGNLHIFSAILSSAYASADSSYTLSWFLNQHGYIYDVATTTAGGWTARYIDSMTTFPTHVITSAYSTDWDNTTASSVAFGNRLQASRTTDGKHIFCTWEDDFSGLVTDSLIAPDVKSEAYDVATAVAGPPIQFTNTENNYYLCVSDIVLQSVVLSDSTYTVPCTITYPQSIPSDGSTPVNYFYLDSVVFNSALALSVPKVVASQGFSVTPNYPNPFSNITNFNITLSKESTVTVDVFNLLGEKVSTLGTQQMSNGTHQMTINGNGWNAGVYLYRVTVNGQTVTNKMMVK
jgi:hypothetical protein